MDVMRIMSHIKTAFLLGSLMGLCMLAGHLLGGPQGLLVGLALGGVGNLLAYCYSEKLALTAMQAHEVTRAEAPWLVDIVEQLAREAGIPAPRVYVCPQEAPNAFATGRNPQNGVVAVTQGMLRGFPQDEVAAVLAHEIAHIKHRDVLISTMAAVMAGVISYTGYMLMFFGGGQRSDNPLGAMGALAMVLLAPIGAMLIQLAISRSREYAADAYAGELTGNPRALAAALQRLQSRNERVETDVNPAFHSLFIVQPLSGGASLASWFSTHPSTEKRIAALRRQAVARDRQGGMPGPLRAAG
jgi:heat shock protein HtpX